MTPQTSTTHRRRRRTPAEQMYWDSLTPAERLAFTIGYAVGRGVDFPTRDQIAVLRTQLGLDTPTSQKPKRTYTSRQVARAADVSRFTYDLATVADAARAAIIAGVPAPQAVMAAIPQCASLKAASVAIARARKAGHDIPYVRPRPGGGS